MSINRRADKRTDELEKELEELEARQPSLSPTPPEASHEDPQPSAETVELSPEEATWKKRFGDLRRHSQKLQDRITELETKAREATNVVLPDTKEKMKEWANKNPQVAAIIRAIALEEAGNANTEIKTQFEEVSKLKAEIEREKVEAKVRFAHKDFDNIVADAKFHDWAEKQPEWVQDKIYDNLNAEDTIWAISLYKKETGVKSGEVERETAKSVGRPSRTSPSTDEGKRRFTESMVEKMTPEEFEKNWEAIQKDMRTPEFYDKTAGAR